MDWIRRSRPRGTFAATCSMLCGVLFANCGVTVPTVQVAENGGSAGEAGGGSSGTTSNEAGNGARVAGAAGLGAGGEGGTAHATGGTPAIAGAAGTSNEADPDTPCGHDIDGLVVHMNFDDCSPTYRKLRDRIGLVDADMHGDTQCAVGRFGRGIYFGGPAHVREGAEYSYVEEADRPELHFEKQLTVSMWVSVWDPPDDTWAILLGKWFTRDSFQFTFEDSLFRFKIALPNGEWGEVFVAEAPAVKYHWAHLAGVTDGQKMRVYVNGIAGAPRDVDLSRDIQESTRPLQLGGIVYNGSTKEGLFSGILDDVRLYNRALGAAEVRRLACLD